MSKVRILVVDDMEIVRKGYEILFSKSSAVEICGMGTSGDDALKLYEELKPDVVVMDIVMPGKDGLKTCKELVFKHEEARVILNTSAIKEEVIKTVMASGAKGLLLKDAEYSEMENAIITVNRGGEFYNKQVLDILVQRLLKTNTSSLKEYWGNRFSDREISIIQLTSKGLSSIEIGKELNVSKRTIEVSRGAILKKMNVSNIVEMIIEAYKSGLLDIN
jgi:DNA-binding NarL/FixJ family response regulator